MTADPFERVWPEDRPDVVTALAAVPDEPPGLDMHPGRRVQGMPRVARDGRRPSFTPLQADPLPQRTREDLPARWAGALPPRPLQAALRQHAATESPAAPAEEDRTPLYDLTEQQHRSPDTAEQAVQLAPDRDGTWLLDFHTDLLDDAAEGCAQAIRLHIDSCGLPDSRFCDNCMAAILRLGMYARLAELLETALGDKALLGVLLAEGWREG